MDKIEHRIWFDTEFIEDGKTIDLISIGMVREDGATYYAESAECDIDKASDWVRENVFPTLTGVKKSRAEIARDVIEFAGKSPEFWAYYADYDWVALCQIFGTMMDLPAGWPMYCRDIKQLCDSLGNPALPKQKEGEHNALADAQWNREAHAYLAATTSEPVAVKGLTRTDILREWFGGERYARDYEYLDANFGKQAEQIVTYIRSCLTTPPAAPTAIDVAIEALANHHCYTMCEPHLSGYRVIMGFETLKDAQDAQQALASLKATRETA